jgi:hypothetical protein
MNMFKVAILSLAVLAGVAAPADADANGRRHHRGHGHGHGHAHFGFYFGAPFFPYYAAPYYPYYPRYYYPPTVVVPAPSSPAYIERGALDAPAPSASTQGSPAYWYYCTDSQTYYPYVQRCATPWQQVVPQVAPPPS